jgi:hypothetical protein
VNLTAHLHLVPKRLGLPPTFTLVSCSAYFSTLKMETIFSSETSVDFQRTTRSYIPEDSTLRNHRCENLNSKDFNFTFYILFILGVGGWDWVPWYGGRTCAHCTSPRWRIKGWSNHGMIIGRGNRSVLRRKCLSTTLSNINPARTALGLNPDLSGKKPATTRLSYGSAYLSPLLLFITAIK